MRTCFTIAALLSLIPAGVVAAREDAPAKASPPATASPAAQRLRDALLRELERGNLHRAVELALQAAAASRDTAVRGECLSLLRSVARQSLRQDDYVAAEKALSAMLRLAPNDTAAAEMTRTIADARSALLSRLKEAKRFLEVEWYEPAFLTLGQAVALAPERRSELADDYFRAAVGVGDDHYFTKNFRDAFYAYDAAVQLRPADGSAAAARLTTRWLQSMVFALVDDVDRASFSPQFWRVVLHRVAAAPKASAGDAELRGMVRGLAAEDSGDTASAAREYADVAAGEGAIAGDGLSVMDARRAAIAQLRRMYDPDLSDRRSGIWRKRPSGDWRILEVPGFRIHHRNEHAARAVANALAFHFDRICKMLDRSRTQVPWPVACDIWLYHDKPQYINAVHPKADAVLASSDIRLRNGKLDSHAIHATQTDPMLLSSTLAHELTHVIVGAATGYRTMPGALAEGLALASEPRGRQVQFARLYGGLAQRRTAAALLKMSESHPTDAAFYAEAANLVARLRTQRGLAPLLNLPDRPTLKQVAEAYSLADSAALDRLITQTRTDSGGPAPSNSNPMRN